MKASASQSERRKRQQHEQWQNSNSWKLSWWRSGFCWHIDSGTGVGKETAKDQIHLYQCHGLHTPEKALNLCWEKSCSWTALRFSFWILLSAKNQKIPKTIATTIEPKVFSRAYLEGISDKGWVGHKENNRLITGAVTRKRNSCVTGDFFLRSG